MYTAELSFSRQYYLVLVFHAYPFLIKTIDRKFEVLSLYFLYYLCLTNLNKQLTGEWAYPIFADLEKKFGWIAPYLFEGVITLIFFILADFGSFLLRCGF
jgi:hypothetical protein